jgi:cell wall assembly regulator SMI1
MENFDEIIIKLQNRKDFEHGHGVSLTVIERAEKELGVKFPSSYRTFLAKFGWGSLGNSEIYGLGDDVPKWLDVVELTKSERTEMLPPIPTNLVPVLNDGGGNHVCIDTSNSSGEAAVMVFWDHELGPKQIPEKIAVDFNDWIISLL